MRKSRQVEVKLPIILIIILLIIGSLKIISLATNEEKETKQISDTIEQKEEINKISEDINKVENNSIDGNTEVTLITCYYEPGYKKATKRFIAKARVE